MFDALKTALAKDDDELKSRYSVVEGENSGSRNNRMMLQSWKGREAPLYVWLVIRRMQMLLLQVGLLVP